MFDLLPYLSVNLWAQFMQKQNKSIKADRQKDR